MKPQNLPALPPPVLTITVRNEKFDVSVDSSGRFVADFDERRYYGASLESLKKQLTTVTRRKKTETAVPYSRLDNNSGQVVHGTGRGIDTRSYNTVLVTENNAKRRLEVYYNTLMFTPLAVDEAETVERLYAAFKNAQEAFEDYTQPRLLHLHDTVKKAVDNTDTLEGAIGA